jgi:hypothetical protein
VFIVFEIKKISVVTGDSAVVELGKYFAWISVKEV